MKRSPLALCITGLLASTTIAAGSSAEEKPAQRSGKDLMEQFANPPSSARPRVWWHWLNGNITKDGIRKDLEWMHRIGIGGVQNFDADLSTPQIVPSRLAFMSPEWKDAFRFAVTTADRLGLEYAIASSAGWSETGGPWVAPADGMKKLVWSETVVEGGRPYVAALPPLPSASGAFQDMARRQIMSGVGGSATGPMAHGDVAVVAFRQDAADTPTPRITLLDGRDVDAGLLTDGRYGGAIDVPQPAAATPSGLELSFPREEEIRSATVSVVDTGQGPFGGPGMEARLEASVDDGRSWRRVAQPTISDIPATVSFEAVRARRFRLLFEPRTAKQAPAAGPDIGAAFGPMIAQPSAPSQPPPVRVAEIRLSTAPMVDHFEQKAGFAVAPNYYDISQPTSPPDKALRDPATIDLTKRMRPDGTLDWTPPRGRWKVVRLGWSLTGATNHPATREATGLEVDKYDPAAVERYMGTYLDRYRSVVGPDLMGKRGIQALLTDSTEVGMSNWTPGLLGEFRRMRGYDPVPWLPALTGNLVVSREASDAFLYDYRRTLAELMASAHYGTLARMAHRQGMIVYGEALEDGRPLLGDDMAMRSYADIPMAAMWTYDEATGPRPTFLADAKGASSVAHLRGSSVVAAESFTSMLRPWTDSPSTLRHVVDLEFALGINRPVIHTSVHQPLDDKLPGLSLAIFGQYFTRHETWADMARPWIDYIARSSYLLQQGRNVADVAYFYGEEAPLTALFGETPIGDAPKENAYDFVDVATLTSSLKVSAGRLTTNGGASYKVLYLGGSSRRITFGTLKRIAALVEAGATVIGEAPEASPSFSDAASYRALVRRLWDGSGDTRVGLGRVIASRDLATALRKAGVQPDFSLGKPHPDSSVLFVHRQVDQGHVFFLSNRADRAERIEASFDVTGYRPQICRADDGRCEDASFRIDGTRTAVTLPFEAKESFFVTFIERTSEKARTILPPTALPPISISGPWHVEFQPGRGAPASIDMPALAPLNEAPVSGIRYFSGIATYTSTFDVPASTPTGAPMTVDLGDVRELAEVSVNGTAIGTAWHSPYRLDIGGAVHPGRNQITVRVANLWANRLIGDAQKGATAMTFTPLPTYRADAPLRASGLIGPVHVQSFKPGSVPMR